MPTSATADHERDGVDHLWPVAYPALLLAPIDFVEEIADRLATRHIQDAVARHDTGPICDYLLSLVSLPGISDSVALGWDARHGGITWAAVDTSLRSRPSCPRLGSYWRFQGCGYRKGAGTCAEPDHQPCCPLPRPALRKGGINVASYSLALFIRDVCGGDFVAWLDASLAHADPGPGSANRAERLGIALLKPLTALRVSGRSFGRSCSPSCCSSATPAASDG